MMSVFLALVADYVCFFYLFPSDKYCSDGGSQRIHQFTQQRGAESNDSPGTIQTKMPESIGNMLSKKKKKKILAEFLRI